MHTNTDNTGVDCRSLPATQSSQNETFFPFSPRGAGGASSGGGGGGGRRREQASTADMPSTRTKSMGRFMVAQERSSQQKHRFCPNGGSTRGVNHFKQLRAVSVGTIEPPSE
jgi:hypothetical protein